jgi:hypothetical protein
VVGGPPYLGLQGTESWEMVFRVLSKFKTRLVMKRAEQRESQLSTLDDLCFEKPEQR